MPNQIDAPAPGVDHPSKPHGKCGRQHSSWAEQAQCEVSDAAGAPPGYDNAPPVFIGGYGRYLLTWKDGGKRQGWQFETQELAEQHRQRLQKLGVQSELKDLDADDAPANGPPPRPGLVESFSERARRMTSGDRAKVDAALRTTPMGRDILRRRQQQGGGPVQTFSERPLLSASDRAKVDAALRTTPHGRDILRRRQEREKGK